MTTQSNAALPSWGVVATAKESANLLAAFATHHLSLGAQAVHLFLDEPDPDCERILARIPGCHVTICDAAHWQATSEGGARPAGQESRQLRNAQSVYDNTDLDWLLHIDADEFLHLDRPLAEELAHVPEDILCLFVQNYERVFRAGTPQESVFDGVFRVPFTGRLRSEKVVFGEMVNYCDKGFSGYSLGKCLIRTGIDGVLVGIHRPRRANSVTPRLLGIECSSARILHFDGLTRHHWTSKLLCYGAQSRYMGPRGFNDKKQAQIRYLQQHSDNPHAVDTLHGLLKTVDGPTEEKLLALGLLLPIAFDPSPSLAAFGLAGEVDISAAAMDAWLQPSERKPDAKPDMTPLRGRVHGAKALAKRARARESAAQDIARAG